MIGILASLFGLASDGTQLSRMPTQSLTQLHRDTLTNSANDEWYFDGGSMIGTFLITICILGATLAAEAQAPGIDPRGLAAASAPLIIGTVEGPGEIVIRPDKLPKAGPIVRRPNGTYIAELPQMTLDYMVGYIYHVRVQEVLKADNRVRLNKTIEIFAPHKLEGGVSLIPKQHFLLALARFEPKKEDFAGTSVRKVGELTKQGAPFNLRARYYTVAGDANGAVFVTEKNRRLIEEIRAAIHQTR